MKLGTITAPEMDYSHEEKGDALYAFEFGAFLASALSFNDGVTE